MCNQLIVTKCVRRLEIGAITVIAALLCLPHAAHAAACSVSPQGVNFGTYDPFGSSPLEGVGNINVSCDVATNFSISLGTGTGSYSTRLMSSGANQMNYNLYRDPARLLVWGDGTANTSTVSAEAGGDFTVYARAVSGQNLPAGSYSDILIVTVTY
jgi:spore coat protein U-like protein